MIDLNRYTDFYENALRMDLKDVYNSDAITGTLRSDVFNENLTKEFTEHMKILVSGDDIKKRDMMEVLNCTLREYLLKGGSKNKNVYLSLYFIVLYYGISITYTNKGDSWIKAICMVIFIMKNPIIFNINGMEEIISLVHLKNSHPNQVAIIEAYKYFRKAGINLKFTNGKIEINKDNEKNIFSIIDYNFSKIGLVGQHILIERMQKFKNPNTGLFKFTNNNNEMITPLPFLLKISLKYASKECNLKEKEIETYFNRALQVATNYIALYDLQTHSYDFKTMYADESTILDIIQKAIVSDQIFKIDQYYFEDVVNFVNFLILRFDEAGYSFENIETFKNVMNAFASVSCRDRIGFNHNNLQQLVLSDANIDLLKSILDSISFSAGSNKKFIDINSLDKLDYNFKPLYKIKNYYFILDKNIFSIGFYEIYAKFMRENLPSINRKQSLFDSEAGNFIEDYIAEKLSNKRINFRHGEEYRFTENFETYEGECDFIIETDNRILFFECKKKPLTRKAKSGDIYHFLSDVACSLYASQIQNNRHELILKRYGCINFLSGFKLNLNDREVIKISVTSLEFLSLHDKILSQRMLRSLYGRVLVAHPDASEDQKNRLNRFNKIANSFTEIVSNAELKYQIEHPNGFSNTVFINMFHLFYVLRFSNDTNTFVSSLLSTKNIVTSAKDFYTEHSNLI